jgi:hypothetical protein
MLYGFEPVLLQNQDTTRSCIASKETVRNRLDWPSGGKDMDPKDSGVSGRRTDGAFAKKPWTAPKVIVSNAMSAANVDNKGPFHIPDRKSSSTSTS